MVHESSTCVRDEVPGSPNPKFISYEVYLVGRLRSVAKGTMHSGMRRRL